MDLHDYKDVAENYDLYVDIIVPKNEALGEESCVEFHTELANKYGSQGIIDIGCGTGCTLLPLVKLGYTVTGLDISEYMIEVLQQKLYTQNLKSQAICSSMCTFSSENKFSLAIIPRSGFLHILTKEEQRLALSNIGKHLSTGGILSLNSFYPNIDILSQTAKEGNNKFLRIEYKNAKGNIEKIYNESKYDFETQVSKGKWTFEEYDNNGQIISTRERPIAMRFTFRSEIEYLIELCGFEIIDVYGGYDKRQAKYPGNLVWVLKKK